MSKQLDEFLNGNARADDGELPPAANPEPMGDQAPVSTPEPLLDDDGAPPVPNEPSVPREALIAERQKRQDWKEKASRAEGQLTERDAQLAELKRQLEEAKKAPPPAQAHQVAAPQQPQEPPKAEPPPSPIEDPEGFVQWNERRMAEKVFNATLNLSEASAKRRYGDETVATATEAFKRSLAANPSLREEFVRQPDPYEWVVQHAKREQAAQEVGSDISAFKEKLKAEFRAEFEAELAAKAAAAPPLPDPVPAAPVVQLPTSIATARSAAPRNAPAFTGPTPMEVILKPSKPRR